MKRLLVICLLVMVIHIIDTLAYSTRLAGVRAKRLATSLALFNIIVIISRTANLFQLPLLGSIVDEAINSGARGDISWLFRVIILSATAGSIIGALLTPTFVTYFMRAIHKLDQTGSVPQLLVHSLSPRRLPEVCRSLRLPDWREIRRIDLGRTPRSFLLLNVVVVAIYVVGVLSAIYAGYLLPDYRLTASQLSGIINGVATILLVILVDPVLAMLTDQTLQGKRRETELKAVVILLLAGKIAGTVLAQLFFLPASRLVVFVTGFIAR